MSITNTTTINWADAYDSTIASDAERYLFIIWTIITLIMCVSGNILVLVASIRYNAIKLDKVSVVLIKNLAIADVIYAVTKMIPTIANITWKRMVLGEIFCGIESYYWY